MEILKESLGTITYDIQANAARYNNRNFLFRTLSECIQREDNPLLFLDRRPKPEQEPEPFFEDPLMIDNIQLLDRLDLDVESQLSIGDMLN